MNFDGTFHAVTIKTVYKRFGTLASYFVLNVIKSILETFSNVTQEKTKMYLRESLVCKDVKAASSRQINSKDKNSW